MTFSQMIFRDRKCCSCKTLTPFTEEVLGRAYCIDCFEKLDPEFVKEAMKPVKSNAFLCGDCANKSDLSLTEKMDMAKRLEEGATCFKCKCQYVYANGKYQKVKRY